MSILSLVPVLTLALRESSFVLIALGQAALVFFLCLASKSRGVSIAIGTVGAVVALMVGDNRYGWIDLLFVIVATLSAVWNLTPYKEGETRGEVLAFAGKAVGVVVLLIAWGVGWLWYYNSKSVPSSPPPVVHQSPPPPSVDVLPSATGAAGDSAFSVPARAIRRVSPSDKRHCLDFRDSAAVARCAEE